MHDATLVYVHIGITMCEHEFVRYVLSLVRDIETKKKTTQGKMIDKSTKQTCREHFASSSGL